MQTFSILAAGAALLPLASAHGFVAGVTVNDNPGTWTPGADPVWFYHPEASRPITAGWNALNQDLGFAEINSPADVACHKSAFPSTASVKANAGDSLSIFWNTWPESHKGPTMDYIAPVESFETAEASTLRFTKINEGAFISGDRWVTDDLIANNNTWVMQIPAELAPGLYVLRHEIIALHGAGSVNGAQLYPQCINLEVGGSGTVALPEGVLGSELYTPEELVFNGLYGDEADRAAYKIPGPAVFDFGSGGSQPAPVTPTPVNPTAPVTPTPVIPTPVNPPAAGNQTGNSTQPPVSGGCGAVPVGVPVRFRA